MNVIPEGWCRNPDESLNRLGRALNRWNAFTVWFRPYWWAYILGPREDHWRTASWLATAWCRATGHRGEVYYNSGGLEPDHSCKGCGEQIG